MNKILIANHDEFEAKGIQWLIESSISNVVVNIANNLLLTEDILENDHPDIFIYDLDIGNGESLEKLTKTLKITQPAILSLTMEATFEAAKKAIDLGTRGLLLKPFSPQELISKIQHIIRDLEQKRKNPIKTNDQTPPNKIEYEHLFLTTNEKAEPYIFIACQPEKTAVLDTLKHFLKTYMFPVTPQLFPLSDMVICLFRSPKMINWSEICKRLMQEWDLQHHDPLCIIINHEKHPDLTIHEKYLHTKKMSEVTFFVGYKQVLEFSRPINWNFIDPFLSPSEQRLWISFLNEGNKEGIREFLYKEFLQIKDQYPDPGLLRIRLTSILAQIRRHMKTFQLDQNPYEQEYLQLFETILYEPLIYRILQKLMTFTSKILDAVIQTSHHQHLDIIGQCIHFIESNYWNQQLDLPTMSKVVHRNPAYLSHLFVEKKSKSFREMLNEIRIREAKKLLIETDMSINEVSSLTGFQNQQYFSRVFKRWMGKSPKQYRMMESIR